MAGVSSISALSAGARRQRAAKYWAIFRVSFAERMTYRGDFLLGTLLRFLPMVTTILLVAGDLQGIRKNRARRLRRTTR